MMRIMAVFSRMSKALDSKIIGEVALALQDFDERFNYDQCEDAIESFLFEFTTWDLTKSPEISENAVRHLITLLTNRNSLKRICEKIVKDQTAIAVQIAVETMIGNDLTLSHEDCREVWKKIESRKIADEEMHARMIEEYSSRTTANVRILRVSGTPYRFLVPMLLDTLRNYTKFRNSIPVEMLKELASLAPFHPILIAEDAKNGTNASLIPHIMSEEHRFRIELAQFTSFFQNPTSYHKTNARSMLTVFHGICNRMNCIELLQGEDIESVVDFWLSALCIFDGYGIGLDDIQEAAKLIEKTTERFEIKRRPIFLKRFLRKLSENQDSQIGLEPQLVATIITTFQRNAFKHQSTEFYEELGEFWTLCMKLKYEDVYLASAFYSSVFALAQAQALFRVKKELCRAVYEQILKPMHQQMVDFVKLKNVESNKAETEEQKMILEQKNLGASNFSILTCTYKNAEDRILEFLDQQ